MNTLKKKKGKRNRGQTILHITGSILFIFSYQKFELQNWELGVNEENLKVVCMPVVSCCVAPPVVWWVYLIYHSTHTLWSMKGTFVETIRLCKYCKYSFYILLKFILFIKSGFSTVCLLQMFAVHFITQVNISSPTAQTNLCLFIFKRSVMMTVSPLKHWPNEH